MDSLLLNECSMFNVCEVEILWCTRDVKDGCPSWRRQWVPAGTEPGFARWKSSAFTWLFINQFTHQRCYWSLTGTHGTICSSDGLYPASGSSAVLRRSHHTTQRDPRTRNLQGKDSQPTLKVQRTGIGSWPPLQGQGKPQHDESDYAGNVNNDETRTKPSRIRTTTTHKWIRTWTKTFKDFKLQYKCWRQQGVRVQLWKSDNRHSIKL